MSLHVEVARLESAAQVAAREAGVADYTWHQFISRLRRLKDHHLGMYAHGLRVGLYSYGIAGSEGWSDRRLPFLGGCGHDVGKVYVPCAILDSVASLTEAEFAVIHRHPEDTYDILKDDFPLAAMVGGLHHKFTPKAYGISLDNPPPWLQAAHTHKVIEATMVVMVADCADAMLTRRNASTVVDPDDVGAVLERLREIFPDWRSRVGWIGENQIPTKT